jgi:hypothetical protein
VPTPRSANSTPRSLHAVTEASAAKWQRQLIKSGAVSAIVLSDSLPPSGVENASRSGTVQVIPRGRWRIRPSGNHSAKIGFLSRGCWRMVHESRQRMVMAPDNPAASVRFWNSPGGMRRQSSTGDAQGLSPSYPRARPQQDQRPVTGRAPRPGASPSSRSCRSWAPSTRPPVVADDEAAAPAMRAGRSPGSDGTMRIPSEAGRSRRQPRAI